MKRRAFFQAVFIVLFFVGSWFFLFYRMRKEEPAKAPEAVAPLQSENQEIEDPAEPVPGKEELIASPEPGNPTPPESWNEWINYLDSSPSPEAMRAALSQLSEALLAMPAEEAIQSIVDFLESGADLKTGLAFQPGPDHTLIGSGSLRAILLDLLSQLDPALAAEWAETELTNLGTSLTPDVYAIHLRNYALGSDSLEASRLGFLNERVRDALDKEEWMTQPVSAIAEMLDVAVYTGATDLVPNLSGLMEREDPQMLRGAAALAIERLVDGQPVDALQEILQQKDWPNGMEKARAGYFARLDPTLEGAEGLLRQYLSSPMVNSEEARFFLLSFPNLNRSFSNNLLSSQNSITTAAGDAAVMESALEQVRSWRASPDMDDLKATLEEVEEAILVRLYGRVSP